MYCSREERGCQIKKSEEFQNKYTVYSIVAKNKVKYEKTTKNKHNFSSEENVPVPNFPPLLFLEQII
jgi:hypothetical protein